MARICEEVLLPCSRQEAFAAMMAVDFIRKIQPNVGVEFETTLESERLIRYRMKVGQREIQSEKIIIPETFTFVTQRTVSSPGGYSLIIQIFEDHEKGSLLRHIEDFEPQEDEQRMSGLRNRVRQYLQGVQGYFENRAIYGVLAGATT